MSSKQYGLTDRAYTRQDWRILYAPFVLLLALACMAWATQRTAAYFQYHSALGNPFHDQYYWPWMVFRWRAAFPGSDPHGFMSRAIEESQLVYLIPQFLILGWWLFFSSRPKGNATLHGSARWAIESEIKDMGYFAGKGVYVGGWVKQLTGLALLMALLRLQPRETHYYLRHSGPEHVICFAPSRSGKGVCLVVPSLLAWEYSLICLDIKGENWSLTSGFRESQGHVCLKFDPSDTTGSSCRYNPFAEVRLDSMLAISDCQNLAVMLVDPDGKGLEDHWAKAGFGLLAGALLHCCITTRLKEGRDATLYDLSCMLADESRTTTELFEEMVNFDHVEALQALFPDSGAEVYGAKQHTFVASAAKELLNKSENEGSGVVSTVLVNLSLYRDPVVAANTSACDFRLADLMNNEKPVSLYLVVSPAEIDRVRPLIRLMVDAIIRYVCRKMEFADGATLASYKHRLLMYMDELTSLGKLPILEKALAYCAGYGVKMVLIVQDISQLNGTYGENNAILSNTHIRVSFAPNTVTTAQMLSDLSGKTTAIDEKVSLSGSRMGFKNSASVSINETARPLLTPDECLRLPGAVKDSSGKVIRPGDMLIFTAGKNPIYGRQILYFRDPVLSARSKMAPAGSSADFAGGRSASLYLNNQPDSSASGASLNPEGKKATQPAPNSQQESDSYAYFQ